MSIQLLKAGTSDVMKLNGISKRAFESDTLVRAASPGEPPGYMSMSFHIFRNVGDESINKDELDDIQNAYSEFTPLNPALQ